MPDRVSISADLAVGNEHGRPIERVHDGVIQPHDADAPTTASPPQNLPLANRNIQRRQMSHPECCGSQRRHDEEYGADAGDEARVRDEPANDGGSEGSRERSRRCGDEDRQHLYSDSTSRADLTRRNRDPGDGVDGREMHRSCVETKEITRLPKTRQCLSHEHSVMPTVSSTMLDDRMASVATTVLQSR